MCRLHNFWVYLRIIFSCQQCYRLSLLTFMIRGTHFYVASAVFNFHSKEINWKLPGYKSRKTPRQNIPLILALCSFDRKISFTHKRFDAYREISNSRLGFFFFFSMPISTKTFNYEQSPFFFSKHSRKKIEKVSRCIVVLHLAHAVTSGLLLLRLIL